MPKCYLGDGVYIDDGPYAGAYVLTTENGISTTNTIVLEPEVLAELLRHISTRRGPRDPMRERYL